MQGVGAASPVPEREQRELAAWSKSVEVLVADAGAHEVEQRAARSKRALRGNRRVQALAMGERGSWAGTGVGASTAQMQAA
jgi:hypothetical protein